MSNYRMAIQYDGTRYRGWQSLSETDATIQGKLETVLSQMTGEEVAVIGSGRTDAGVHAIGQVANFHLQGTFDEHALLADLNRYLPEDIAVSSLELVDDRFHSRYQATRKTYRYRIHTGEIPEVFERKYVYDYRTPLDVGRMREAAGLLRQPQDEKIHGAHDLRDPCGGITGGIAAIFYRRRIFTEYDPDSDRHINRDRGRQESAAGRHTDTGG